MIRQPIFPSFDDQLREAIRRFQAIRSMVQRDLARESRVGWHVISAWMKDSSRSIRLATAETLAQYVRADLRTTRHHYSSVHPRRQLEFDRQIQLSIGTRDLREVLTASEVALTRLQAWQRFGSSKLLLREAYSLCFILKADLLVPDNSFGDGA